MICRLHKAFYTSQYYLSCYLCARFPFFNCGYYSAVICTAFSNGRRHDFRLFKESKGCLNENIKVLADSALHKMGVPSQDEWQTKKVTIKIPKRKK